MNFHLLNIFLEALNKNSIPFLIKSTNANLSFNDSAKSKIGRNLIIKIFDDGILINEIFFGLNNIEEAFSKLDYIRLTVLIELQDCSYSNEKMTKQYIETDFGPKRFKSNEYESILNTISAHGTMHATSTRETSSQRFQQFDTFALVAKDTPRELPETNNISKLFKFVIGKGIFPLNSKF